MRRPRETLAKVLFLPAHERLRGRETLSYLGELRRVQRLGREAFEAYREEKIRRLLTHCATRVPYYRELFTEAQARSGSQGLSGLPALERAQIRDRLDDLVADGYRGALIRHSTGGSTGSPLVFYSDKRKEARHNGYKLRCREWFGVRPGDRQVDFWGSPIELDKQSRLRIWKDRWLLNQVLLSAFDLTESRLAGYAGFLRRYRPRLIYGYPTVIYRVAQFIEEARFDLQGYRPGLVVCTSEMLYPHQRTAIERVFDCRVANEYGSRDGGLIAHECPNGRMHVAAEHVVVEVDDPDASGVGDLLITNLDGYGMPLIRYRVGDRGRLGSAACDCGLPTPVLEELSGRSNDFVVGKDGKLIHSLAPIYVLREIPKVAQFKIVQQSDGSLDIDLVCREPLTQKEIAALTEDLQRVFGYELPVRYRFADAITPERSGKYRWVVSHALEVA